MDFGLSPPQELLRRSLREHLDRNVPIARVREIMESTTGHDGSLHRELGELGVCGLLVGEEQGGAGLGLLDSAVVAQELGRAACPLSFHSAYVLAPLLLAAAEDVDRTEPLLQRLAAGELLLSPVLGAVPGGDGLSCLAPYVADAGVCERLLVEADGELHLVAPDAEGVAIETLLTVDETRRLAEVRLDGAEAEASLGRLPISARQRALQAARVALAADAFGAAQRGLEAAVDYAKQRQQFGRVIGSFQAVQHVCAEVFAELDPVQSLLWYAAHAWDESSAPEDAAVRELVSLAKAHACDTATFAVTQATQVFGGIGFTWECDMHLWYKRVGYDRQVLGGPEELREMAAAAHLG